MPHRSNKRTNKNDMEQDNLQWQNTPEVEDEIDLMEMAGRLWQKRKLLITAGIIGAVVGVVVAFSIPKKYAVTVQLSRESTRSTRNGLSAASLLGWDNMMLMSSDNGDALNMLLYPEILNSNPFAIELYDMMVTTRKGERMPLNEYMGTQRSPWWSWLLGLPMRAVGAVMDVFRKEEEGDGEGEGGLNPFRLSKEEAGCLGAIKKSMTAEVDKKMAVATITVSLQDPVVTAMVADSVVCKLEEFITDYRTKKAVKDCEYLEKLYVEYQEDYYDAQQRYATYVDGNKNLYTHRSMVEGERLQNEMNQAYQIYSQVASQLQVARTKVQEAKPVFAVVNPASVPLKPSAPNKKMILVAFVFLACAGAAAWVLWGEGLWASLKNLTAGGKEKEEDEK